MARARNIKPGFFESEQVGEVEIGARLLFIALWQLADRAGRLEDRPLRIRSYAFRYDTIGVEQIAAWMDQLEAANLIVRYQVDAMKLVEIPAFTKHQHPHYKEPESTLPSMIEAKTRASLGLTQGKPEASLGQAQGESRASLGQALDFGPIIGQKSRVLPLSSGKIPGQARLNPESLLLNADGADGAEPAPPAKAAGATQQQQQLSDFGSEPDPSQLVSDACEMVTRCWPNLGSVPNAKRAWEREAAGAVEGVAEWCRKIQQTALVHAMAHVECRKANPRHFVPTLERWVVDGDYARKPPETPPKQRGMTRVIDMFPETENAS